MDQAAQDVTWQTLSKVSNDQSGKKKRKIPPEIASLVGNKIKMKGFIMPLDFESNSVSEFILMPFVPSCSHVPPPPPNQMAHVKMLEAKKVEASYYPVEVEGFLEMNPEKSDIDTIYLIQGVSVTEIKSSTTDLFTPPNPHGGP